MQSHFQLLIHKLEFLILFLSFSLPTPSDSMHVDALELGRLDYLIRSSRKAIFTATSESSKFLLQSPRHSIDSLSLIEHHTRSFLDRLVLIDNWISRSNYIHDICLVIITGFKAVHSFR